MSDLHRRYDAMLDHPTVGTYVDPYRNYEFRPKHEALGHYRKESTVTTPKLAQRDPTTNSRFYDWKGQKLFSVTAILQALSKPALPQWAANLAADFALANPGAERDDIRFAHRKVMTEAAEVGSAVHHAVDDFFKTGESTVYESHVAPFMEAFFAWLEQAGAQIVLSEFTVFHPAEAYAGTADLLVDIGGVSWLVDIKTGNNVWPEASLQLSAYSRATVIATENPLGNWVEKPMPKVDAAAVLHLRPGEFKFCPVRIDDEVYMSFKYVRECFRFQNEIAKTVFLNGSGSVWVNGQG